MKRPANLADADEMALSATELVLNGAVAPSEVLLMPFGDPVPARDGRVFRLIDHAHAERVVAATRQALCGCDMMIDYDHMSSATPTQGGSSAAKAAGWIKNFEIRADGIWGTQVEWTPPAATALANREYRYSSPNFRVAKASREVTQLTNLGLVNEPNFDLPALASQELASFAGVKLNMKNISIAALAAALALTGDPGEAEVLAAIGKLKSDGEGAITALASIRTDLALADDADTETVLAAVATVKAAGTPDPTKFVPKAGFDALNERLGKIEDERVLASVDQAVRDGKIPPAMKQWAIDLGKKDEAALASYIDKSPAIVGSGSHINGELKVEKGKLTAEEQAICSMTGVSATDFLKTRDEEVV